MSRPASYSADKQNIIRNIDHPNLNIEDTPIPSPNKPKKTNTFIMPTNSTFVTNPKGPVIIQDEAFVKVYDLYDQLSNLIENLDSKIDDILSKHENEFEASYRTQMYKIHQELKDLKRKTDETEIKIRQNEQIQSLEKSVNLFKEESLKLTESINKKNKEIQSLKSKVKFLEEERAFLTSYLKTVAAKAREQKLNNSQGFDDSAIVITNPTYRSINSKGPITINGNGISDSTPSNRNRSLSGLKKNKEKEKDTNIFQFSKIQHEELEYNTGLTKLDEFLNDLKERGFEDKFGIINDIQIFIRNLVDNYETKLKIVKKGLNNEFKDKIRILSQRTGDFSTRTELENIFIDCIEQVRREIIKRKTHQKNYYDKLQKQDNHEPIENDANQIKIDFKQFLSNDKYRILELFLTNEQVLVALYDKLFPKPGGNVSSAIISNSVNQNLTVLNTTGDIESAGNNPKDILDGFNKESGSNFMSNSISAIPSSNLDNFNVPDLLIRQKKKLPETLLHRKKNDEFGSLPFSETKKKINDLLSDSTLYSEIKISTRIAGSQQVEFSPARKRSDWKPTTDGKRFKI